MKLFTHQMRIQGAVCLLIAVCSCGIGPSNDDEGDSSEGDPAQISLTVSPTIIDSGDRMDVYVTVSDLTQDDIAVKVRFPKQLSYVYDSSSLTINETIYDASPLSDDTDSTYRYLVYYFNREDFEPQGEGVLYFSLDGESDVASGTIGIDSDFDDSQVDDRYEFDVANPQFDAQAEIQIRVGSGSSSSSSSSSSSTSSSSASSSSSS